jgi:hypothetical protein
MRCSHTYFVNWLAGHAGLLVDKHIRRGCAVRAHTGFCWWPRKPRLTSMLDHWLHHHACTLINANLCASAGVEPWQLANTIDLSTEPTADDWVGPTRVGSRPAAIQRHSILLPFLCLQNFINIKHSSYMLW